MENMVNGVIRRIDDLGRIVITREMRRSLGLCEGTPMVEVMTPEGILLKPYYSHSDLGHLITTCISLLEENKEQYPNEDTYKQALEYLKQSYQLAKDAKKEYRELHKAST